VISSILELEATICEFLFITPVSGGAGSGGVIDCGKISNTEISIKHPTDLKYMYKCIQHTP